MPIREYVCSKCGEKLELIQSCAEKPPICFNDGCNIEMCQLFPKTNFQLKGERWARDGYSGKKR